MFEGYVVPNIAHLDISIIVLLHFLTYSRTNILKNYMVDVLSPDNAPNRQGEIKNEEFWEGRQRGFGFEEKEREAEKEKKRAALAPGRIRNFEADYLLGRAGDAGFGRERPCRLTHLLNEYAVTLG
ncbi:hypothetical protein AVEN_233251-1 [Araneus ventricosus]|uniref:Uncharacterized protein n=1 Tax=Araneus ventricosus TaxID=182803 RepID=A0A4Y2EIU0_ARAVE|nr:hypothetical protein AVEN_233251-1 [Araneus ventricosus]